MSLRPSRKQPHTATPADVDHASRDAATHLHASPARGREVATRFAHPFATGFVVTLGVLGAILLGIALRSLSTVLIYIVLALFVALGLDPIVRRLERHNIKRGWGILIVFAGFLVVMTGVVLLILPPVIQQIVQFATSIPTALTEFQQSDFYKNVTATFGANLAQLVDEAKSFISNPSNLLAIGGGALQFGAGVVGAVSGSFIVVVLTLYFLASLGTMKLAFYRLVPAHSRTKVAGLTDQITDSVGGYLIGMVILAASNSVLAFFLHLILGLPFPALMALLAFLITLIPLIGSVLYWVLASVIALFTSPLLALIFALVYLAYMQLEAYFLTPKVMNKTISIPGSLVVIGALVGGTLLGLIGALVAIPVTASILLLIKQVFIPKQDAKLSPS